MPWGFLALLTFWTAAIKLWIFDGAKIPLIFVGLWLIGFFVFPKMHWTGGIFLAHECILAIILLLVDRYKSLL
jgi:hypothetical protein